MALALCVGTTMLTQYCDMSGGKLMPAQFRVCVVVAKDVLYRDRRESRRVLSAGYGSPGETAARDRVPGHGQAVASARVVRRPGRPFGIRAARSDVVCMSPSVIDARTCVHGRTAIGLRMEMPASRGCPKSRHGKFTHASHKDGVSLAKPIVAQ
ncbi:hypothetical protein GCM10010282_44450 [Streptomyces roseolus]|nr:hypothetical protein GCM10010282_44450 [Streptomyces roseolus]